MKNLNLVKFKPLIVHVVPVFWKDKLYGNTYFSVVVELVYDGRPVGSACSGMEYGYGSHYKYIAAEIAPFACSDVRSKSLLMPHSMRYYHGSEIMLLDSSDICNAWAKRKDLPKKRVYEDYS